MLVPISSSLHPCAQIHLCLESSLFSAYPSLGSGLGDGAPAKSLCGPRARPPAAPDEQQAQTPVESMARGGIVHTQHGGCYCHLVPSRRLTHTDIRPEMWIQSAHWDSFGPGLQALAWAVLLVSSLAIIQVSAFLSPGNGEVDYCAGIT